jgi:integrase
MAEITESKARDGKKAWKVKIFLGRITVTGKDGKPRRKTQYLIKTIRGNKSDAEKWAREQETLRDTGKLYAETKMTVGEWLDKWLEWKQQRVRLGTLESYREVCRFYIAGSALSAMLLVRARALDVQNFYDSLVARGLSPRTIQYAHSILHSAFQHALGMELIKRNPAEFTLRPTKKKPRIICFNREESARFLEAAKADRYHVLWVVALTLGLRCEEFTALQFADVDFEKKTLRVERVVKFHKAVYETDKEGKKRKTGGGGFYFGEPKSASAKRTLRLSDTQVELLRMQKTHVAEMKAAAGKGWHENNFFFPSADGTPMNRGNLQQRHFEKILKRAGLENSGITIHGLRHSFATLSLLAGVDVKTVSARLGHADVAFTLQTYAHVLEEMEEQAADKIEAIFFAAPPPKDAQPADDLRLTQGGQLESPMPENALQERRRVA